ncbi:hypothetical protein ACPVPU_12600 [Sphingomonas sp. CJ99]
MTGIIYTEAADIDATTGRMLVTFTSGGTEYRFHIPADVALRFRHQIMTDGWRVCCAPDADVVSLAARRAKARRDRSARAREGSK